MSWHERGLAARPVAERATVDELGDEILAIVELACIVDRQNMRMIQGGRDLGFALEAAARLRIGQRRGQELDRDLAVQPCVVGAIHLAHPTRTDEGDDLIEPYTGARRKRHRSVCRWIVAGSALPDRPQFLVLGPWSVLCPRSLVRRSEEDEGPGTYFLLARSKRDVSM